MRIVAIALKDLKQFTRSIPTLVLSLAAPLVLTAIIGFAFGGLGGTSTPGLPVTTLQVANLDQGQPGAPANFGQQLVKALQGAGLAKLVQVTPAADEAAARAAVDSRQTEMALIIPANLTEAVMAPEGQAVELVLVHDPALTLRPKIVADVIQRLLDTFWGARVAAQVTAEQLAARGAPQAAIGEAANRTGETLAHEAKAAPALTIGTRTATAPAAAGLGNILAKVNAGMLVFFMFYTAGIIAQTIIKEEEDRTLQRMFSAPASRATILAGKFLSVFLIVSVQTVLVVVAGALLFGAKWGSPAGIAVQILGSVTAAAGLGLLLMSFARNTRQAGSLLGGALSVLGMAGGLFTVGFTNLPPVFGTIALCTPHGWAMKGWNVLLEGGEVGAVLGPAAVTAAAGVIFLGFGAHLLGRRYR